MHARNKQSDGKKLDRAHCHTNVHRGRGTFSSIPKLEQIEEKRNKKKKNENTKQNAP